MSLIKKYENSMESRYSAQSLNAGIAIADWFSEQISCLPPWSENHYLTRSYMKSDGAVNRVVNILFNPLEVPEHLV